nr:DNA alkylation repair protein [Candidatus Njordarchaeota archaeon]
MEYEEILKRLKSLYSSVAVAGMARYGINPNKNYGVSIPNLRIVGKESGIDHHLAQQLWTSGIHDAKILASMIDDPSLVTEQQMENWVKDFDSWDVCDQCCMNLFARTEFARQKVVQWSKRNEEFVKRAAFTLMVVLAVHDKEAPNSDFERFLSIVEREALDERNYVKKAVNWALRQIGKRNLGLNKKAIETAYRIQKLNSKVAKWIASDALRELKGEKVRNRLNKQSV